MKSHLNNEVHLGVHVLTHGLPALAGRVHCVTTPAAPRYSHVTVVWEPRDPLSVREDMRTGEKKSLYVFFI